MPSLLRVLTEQEAFDHVVQRCFSPATSPGAPPTSVGLELELFPVGADGAWFDRTPIELIAQAAHGDGPLPCASVLSFEPGGQVELSTPPESSTAAACNALSADLRELRDRLASHAIALVATGSDPVRPPARVVDTARYRAMEAFFDTSGGDGRRMMCTTASLQVNVGLGPADAVAERWRLAHALGPTLSAAFANSPRLAGRHTGWKSARLATWFAIDPSRTAPPTGRPADFAAYALDARVMLMRCGDDECVPVLDRLPLRRWLADGHEQGWPDREDLDYHLTTLFPPVRPKGWLEIRYLDALGEPWWPVAAAVTTALLDDPEAAAAATRATTGTEGLWLEAARVGLDHPALASSAQACFTAALHALDGVDGNRQLADATAAFTDAYVARRRSPADDPRPVVPPTPYHQPQWT